MGRDLYTLIVWTPALGVEDLEFQMPYTMAEDFAQRCNAKNAPRIYRAASVASVEDAKRQMEIYYGRKEPNATIRG